MSRRCRFAGLKRDGKLTAIGDFSVESGIRAIDTLFAQGQRFTAVFCSNDEMAIGAMQSDQVGAVCGCRRRYPWSASTTSGLPATWIRR